MIYITGDTHGNYSDVKRFCQRMETTIEDTMIVLGDNGLNYYGGAKDEWFKYDMNKMPITLFAIRGNHDKRPTNVKGYKIIDYRGGKVYQQPEFPNLIFAIDGEVYDFDGVKAMVIGGAYSVDKEFRLAQGGKYHWFPNEQLSPEEMVDIEEKYQTKDFDVVLTHTAPFGKLPAEFRKDRWQGATIDSTMEYYFDKLYNLQLHSKWYCGHFHNDCIIDDVVFMYNNIDELTK